MAYNWIKSKIEKVPRNIRSEKSGKLWQVKDKTGYNN